ncbi:KAP family P-loop NTPase fold protein [Paenibacillus kobensis]|uniref:KAP family P-loop NTPase fold protein n=1 Tax=Paenibacillus kobensis TaxID=59841 RepID=UPI000FDC05F6|nr:P-loop NTPase fold protein [Paenibacillus kobensis]
MAPNQDNRTFTTDAPIQDPKLDRFQRWPFAQRVARTIASRRDPGSIVIGIYGAWGDGKTSVVNLIHRELDDHDHVIVIRFNPWLFGTETQLVQNFFNILAESLEQSITTYKEKIGGWLEKYGSLLASPWAMGDTVTGIGKAMNAADINDYRSRLENLLKEQQKRVVIFMDDIDRLDKSEIQTVFKLVKLTGDFAHTTYVLAFDEEMVAAALSEKYGEGGIEAGRHFLEKIVQVPLHLPLADQDTLRSYCFEGVDEALSIAGIELTQNEVESFVRSFVEGLQNRLLTPRIAKRYGNALMFALPILKDEVNPVDLMLVEGIRIFYPQLYDHIRTNPGLYVDNHRMNRMRGDVAKQKELIGQGFNGLSSTDQKCAESLLTELFPKVDAFLESNKRWLNNRGPSDGLNEKRIGTGQYFPRYFLYAIPKNDISDLILASFFNALNDISLEEAVQQLLDLIEGMQPSRFIEKLQQFKEKLTPEAGIMLAKAIAHTEHLFPDETAVFSFLTSRSRSIALIISLLKTIDPGETRLDAAKVILNEIKSLEYTTLCFHKMLSVRDDNITNNEALFTVEEEYYLGLVVVTRIKQRASDGILYMQEENPVNLLETWVKFGDWEGTNEYLQSTFEEDVHNVSHLLFRYLPRYYSVGSGQERIGEFNRDQYMKLQRVIDVDAIFLALKREYGDLLSEPVYEKFNGAPDNQKTAMQFAYIHHQVMNEVNQCE